jgi:maltooligosyltrehalose trehalohydrolase
MPVADYTRHYPYGAEIVPGGGVHFRIWAPICHRVEVVIEGGTAAELPAEGAGWFAGVVENVTAGARYRYRLDGESSLFPDPASRFQPDGPHGPSEIIDPRSFPWHDFGWKGVPTDGHVLYEMHVGTFTPEGTWTAAVARLPELAELGITAICVMPVADFPGRFGWGDDGVCLYAPTRLYGTPDDMRRFVDSAHALGIGVLLSVIYSHFGPDGNYIREFAPQFMSTIHKTDCGELFNFDGPDSGPVREFFIANSGYWIDEFHIDGLCLEATQAIHDDSPDHMIAAISRRVRQAARDRATFVIGENESQQADLVKSPLEGGYGLDALRANDLHHAARVALTGKTEGYFTDYQGTPQEFISAAKWGVLYQGQQSRWQRQRRGTSAFGIPRNRFVTFIENHEQVAASARGLRLHQLTSPGQYRAMIAYLLLGPGTPSLFQGQEYGSTRPFVYFAHHYPELASLVYASRRETLRRFRSLAGPEGQKLIPDPSDPRTFQACKLDPVERSSRPELVALHKDLIALRNADPALQLTRHGGVMDGAVLGTGAFVLRFFHPDAGDRLLIVNLGHDLCLEPVSEPLLSPPGGGARWSVIWSSEDPRYGGPGTAPLDPDESWQLPGETSMLLAARRG